MSSLGTGLGSLEESPDRFTVEALAAVLPQAWVHEAIAAGRRRSERVRLLPDVLTLWTVVLLGLFRRLSYVNLLEMLATTAGPRGLWGGEAPPCSSALTKARDRLGVEPLRRLYEQSAMAWTEQTPGRYFHGRRVFAIDGTTLRVPDTPENDAYFGRPGSGRSPAAYPQVRVLQLQDVGTRLCRAVRFGPLALGEVSLARQIIPDVPFGALVLLDRNFLAYDLLHDLFERGVDFVLRTKDNLRRRVLETLGPGDAIVQIDLPGHWHRDRRDLPLQWILREIRYVPPQGAGEIRLLTTLVLAEEIDAEELTALYPDRWEEETSLDELKIHQGDLATVSRPVLLRSLRPERVEQEIYGLLIAYNAVRITMARAAERVGEPPRRISFTTALTRIREVVRDMMRSATHLLPSIYEGLLLAIGRVLVPLRPGRQFPRAVKIKMSGYPLKRSPPL